MDRSTPAAASLTGDSSSTNDPRRYLSDRMGGQQHARGGGAMRRDARPLPRASDGRGASALTPWLFPHEKANSRCNGTREQKKRKTEIMVQFFIWTYTVEVAAGTAPAPLSLSALCAVLSPSRTSQGRFIIYILSRIRQKLLPPESKRTRTCVA